MISQPVKVEAENAIRRDIGMRKGQAIEVRSRCSENSWVGRGVAKDDANRPARHPHAACGNETPQFQKHVASSKKICRFPTSPSVMLIARAWWVSWIPGDRVDKQATKRDPQMPQFMLVLTGAPHVLDTMSPTEIQGVIEKYNTWRERLTAEGKLVSGRKLMDEGGKHLTKKGDKLTVVDGPYSETKEIVGGYFVLKAADYADAVKLASDCPHLAFGTVQVREIDFMGRPEE